MKSTKKIYVACVSGSDGDETTMIKYTAKNDKEFYLKLIEDIFGDYEDDEWMERFEKKSAADLAYEIEGELCPFEGTYITAMNVNTGKTILG